MNTIVDAAFVLRFHLGNIDLYFDFLEKYGDELFKTHKPERPKSNSERHHLTDPTRLINLYLLDSEGEVAAVMSVKVGLDSRNFLSWELSNILVRLDCQRQGLATRIFREVEESFNDPKNERVREMWLHFNHRDDALRHLYIDKWGFTEVKPGVGRKIKS